ncbi:M14 family metallopeptidase [Candidatus Cyanaurora vandensis]|uniref:M14 family metallopeptidase n=1 Tax=Candidatus Cyanaurora vandensis TaxID=2714958 RepID=UPI002580EFB1|nr:M14 family metallopeptidase [Candidatus Cyanaurora vandensis]
MFVAPKVFSQQEAVFSLELPLQLPCTLWRHRFAPATVTGPLVVVISGLHGDEFDGGYICYRLAHFLQNLPPGWTLRGTVHLLPNANPLGTNISRRFLGFNQSDLNRSFPGVAGGSSEEQLAWAVYQEAVQAEVCVDIHSSNEFLMEVPQVRVADRPRLKNLAQELGLDLVWTHSPQHWIGGTLAQALFERQVHTLVVELGTGRRLHQLWSERVVQGILHLWVRLGVLQVNTTLPILSASYVADENNVFYLSAPQAGLLTLESGLQVGMHVQAGQKLGQVISPTQLTQAALYAPVDGFLFTLRVHPLVYEGSLVGRVVRE